MARLQDIFFDGPKRIRESIVVAKFVDILNDEVGVNSMHCTPRSIWNAVIRRGMIKEWAMGRMIDWGVNRRDGLQTGIDLGPNACCFFVREFSLVEDSSVDDHFGRVFRGSKADFAFVLAIGAD